MYIYIYVHIYYMYARIMFKKCYEILISLVFMVLGCGIFLVVIGECI